MSYNPAINKNKAIELRKLKCGARCGVSAVDGLLHGLCLDTVEAEPGMLEDASWGLSGAPGFSNTKHG